MRPSPAAVADAVQTASAGISAINARARRAPARRSAADVLEVAADRDHAALACEATQRLVLNGHVEDLLVLAERRSRRLAAADDVREQDEAVLLRQHPDVVDAAGRRVAQRRAVVL